MRFDVTLSNPSSRVVVVDYATADGTAHAPGDYTAKTGTLRFQPGVTGRPVAEGDETFSLGLTSAVRCSVGDGTGVATIHDNDSS